MTRLSQHFTLEELTHSDLAIRRGLDNTPTDNVVANLTILAAGLEQVRALLGVPLFITSGYRSAAVNAAVGSSETSAHRLGYAADFVAPAYGTPLDVAKAIAASPIAYDQLIQEGGWVHISFDQRRRGSVLTAHFNGGKATYTAGLA